MRCKIRSLSIGLRSITSICRSPSYSRARYQELIHRNLQPLVQTVRQPVAQMIHNTIRQTVLHLHPTTVSTESGGGIDPSRPTWTARQLLRVLSMESARRTMQPFYQNLFRSVWEREREIYRSQPSRALDTLRRLCLETAHTRYTTQEMILLEEFHYLPPVRRVVAAPERQEPPESKKKTPEAVVPAGGPRLSKREFQALVRDVAGALDRQSRLDRLRRGGV